MADVSTRRLVTVNVRAEFECELEKAKVKAEQIITARDQLRDWVATARESFDLSGTVGLLREQLGELEAEQRMRPVAVSRR